MKKTILLLLSISLFSSGLLSQRDGSSRANDRSGKFSLTVGAGIRLVNEDLYGEVYGNHSLSINLDLALRLFNRVEVFFHSDYLAVSGQLTYSKEDTDLTLTPVEFGARMLFQTGSLVPYIGAGGGLYLFNEKNVIGTVKDNQAGFFAEGGCRIKLARPLFIDLKIKYTLLKASPTDKSIDLGGIAGMIGLGLQL